LDKKGFFGLIGKIVTVVVILLIVGGVFLFFSLKNKYFGGDDDFKSDDGLFPEEKEVLEVIDAEEISFDLHTDSKTEQLKSLESQRV